MVTLNLTLTFKWPWKMEKRVFLENGYILAFLQIGKTQRLYLKKTILFLRFQESSKIYSYSQIRNGSSTTAIYEEIVVSV